MDRKKKRTVLLAGIAAVALIVGFLALAFSIGSIVKAGVNGVLPRITGTKCSMGSCIFNPFSGTVSISDFSIGNPPGYTHPHAFRIGHMEISIALSSLFSEKIVVRRIIIDDMEASLEVKLTETNLTAIKKNIDDFTKKDERATSKPKEEKPDPAEKGAKPAKRLQIDLFRFENSRLIAVTTGKTANIPLPDIVVQDLGQGPEGATAGEIAHSIFYAVYETVLNSASKAGFEFDIGGTVKDGAGRLIDGVRGLFGSDKSDE
ncbi:MAG: hypothetical protein JW808_01980 [Victivallales bacterium]|nr:hypothetical protein [Victivallales bacterium]